MKQTKALQWKITVFALLALGGFIAHDLYKVRGHFIEQEKARILTQARVIARNMESQFVTTNLTLQRLLDDSASLRDPKNREQTNARLALLADALPGIRTLFITDAQGNILTSNRPELIGKNFAHREYFQKPKANPAHRLLYVSHPFETVTHSYTFSITRAILRADGGFDGVVTAGIDASYFEVLLKSVLYAPDMIATINHNDGLRFMIVPFREGQVGKNLAVPGSMFTRHRQSGKNENICIDTGYATGEYRMMALVTLSPDNPMMDKPPCVITGRRMSDLLMDWRKYATVQFFFYLIVCIATISALMMMQKRQKAAREIQEELAESQRRFQDIFDFMPDATLVVDMDKKVIGWNRAIETMSGVPKEAMLGRGNYEYTIPFYGERRPNLINALFPNEEGVSALYTGFTRQGTTLYAETFCPALHGGKGAHIWALVAPLYNTRGEMTGAIESIRDISASKKMEAELKQSNELLASQARLDFLTGIYNRLMFSELLRAEFSGACRHDMPLSLIMFDIDHFKKINDALGHGVGDHVLKELTKLVSSRLRANDIFSRWGGEEFLILLPKSDLPQAERLAEMLREMIAGHDFGDNLRLTVSFGVVSLACEESPETLIERADAALYRAKKSGRNKVATA